MNYLYSVYDNTTGVYGVPFVAANDDNAVRNYLYIYHMPDLAQKLTTELRRIAIWNNETGIVEAVDAVNISSVLYGFIDKLKSFEEVVSDGEKKTD